MNKDYSIRKATIDDVGFLTDVIISAEKSMTDNLGLANFFEVSEEHLRSLIIAMFEEEIDGCEFCVSSFFVVCFKNRPIAALSGWLEAYYDDMPSALLKSNLINATFPIENIKKGILKFDIIKDIQYERQKETYQFEYSHVDSEHRGKYLINRLIDAHLENAKKLNPKLKKAQLQPFENNKTMVKIAELSGFKTIKIFESKNNEILKYFPYNVKLLMEKTF